MKIAILGGGVIGVTSAWYLAQAGHDVVVIDRQNGPALETSFANAGEISPGYASPWAAPGIPAKAVKWLFMKHAPFILRPHLDKATIRWLGAMLANCTEKAYRINKGRMVRLAEYSRDCLIDLRRKTGITYDERSLGTLQLFREQKQLDGIGKDIAILREDGVPFEVLDRAGCIAAEPGLAGSSVPFVGGMRLPHDETGDCYKFTNALADMAQTKGVTFLMNHDIRRIVAANGSISHVETDKGDVQADAFLVSLGSYSPQMVAPLGISLPVYPVKGYSLTLPITDESRAPTSTLLDESYKVAITRLGNRIRIGGMAEIAGFNRDLPPARRATLIHSASSLFPGAGNYEEGSFWSGLRPMTPDSTPVIGKTDIANLFLNTGHGTLGWTMSCGSARVIADIISGQAPAIRADDLAINRY
ncbi:MAG: D-amino acid dehydrogenase [Sphingobium sp.]|nr:D-amino acid dehydrogenase [Sphingobium sp.]